MFRNIEREYPVNINFNNLVDKDVQKMLSPLNLMQYTMFCPKYRIKNNFITPNSLISNFVSMIVTVAFIFLFIFGTYFVNVNKYSLGYSTFIIISFNIACVFFCIGFILNLVIGITQTRNNVQFVLIFQKVHKLFNQDSVNHFIIWNLILGIVALGFYLIIFTCFFVQSGLPFYSVFYCYLAVVFDFNIIYAMRLIKLLENKMNQWNCFVTNFQKLDSHNFSTKEFKAFVDILTCYDLHKNSFQPLVSISSQDYQ